MPTALLRLLIGLVAGCLLALPATAATPSIAFFYGADPPWDELAAFDTIVVEPAHVPAPRRVGIGSDIAAYVSVGEIDRGRPYLADLPAAWRHGDNPEWDSVLVDQSQPEWPAWFVGRVVRPLWDAGYRTFFLDTLDSYHRFAKDDAARAAQEAGLVRVIRALRSAFPEAKLVFNRGFEILPQVHGDAVAVAAESLFQGWDQAAQRYREVPAADREWLLAQLQRVRDEYRKPVIAIDYTAPGERELARRTAARIAALGIVPWVANPALDRVGIGAVEAMPRKVLVLYDGPEAALMYDEAHRFAALPLNWLGYVPQYVNVADAPPAHPLEGRYAGVVTWLSEDLGARAPVIVAWLKRARAEGLRTAVFGRFGVPGGGPLTDAFGLPSAPLGEGAASARIVKRAPLVGFEREPRADRREFFALQAQGGEALLTLDDDRGRTMDAVALTPWGGYALEPFALSELANSTPRWIVQPMEFLRRALALPDMPAPDPTTENGRRLMIVHMDGDGFASRAEFPGTPFSGEVVIKEVIERYRVPMTLSVIEGETAARGLFPQLSPQLEAIAKRMFAYPYVEPASHSFSHPFKWRRVELGGVGEGYSLVLPGYTFSLDAEIDGSIRYIEEKLLPPGKRVGVFLWTGDCNPGPDAVDRTLGANVLNMNGGDTLITHADPTLALVAPLGIPKGRGFQVYAPNQNENVYTGNWTGPFYGFERVIETFELTDAPWRTKPINIYFHTYAATKRASLNALKKAFDWALARPVHNVYASEHIRKVLDFNRMSIARDGDAWRIRGAGDLRTVRLPAAAGAPDVLRSTGVAGSAVHNDQRYVHLAGAETVLRVMPAPAAAPQLADANARITAYQRTPEGFTMRLEGHRPVAFALAGAAGCEVRANDRVLAAKGMRYELPDVAASISIRCRR
jgi:uncharacterized protein (TIGR01370 family)